jgi:DNA invertase Pin-like site-specific DNA recombinase
MSMNASEEGRRTGKKYGYARVSTNKQDPELQLEPLRQAGCDEIFIDVMSGKFANRPELDKLLAKLQPGDTLVIWKLDRLGRTVQHLVILINELRARGIHFRSITDAIDTSTNSGRMVFHIFAAIAEFERGLIVERVMAGLEVAHAKGHHGGRTPSLGLEQVVLAKRLAEEGMTISDISRTLGTSRATIYRAIGETSDDYRKSVEKKLVSNHSKSKGRNGSS